MAIESTVVFGIEIPSTSPVFLSVVALHVTIALLCVVAGAGAMLANKLSPNHRRFGRIYFWLLAAVFLTATVLSSMRWKEDYHLFVLGMLSFGTAWMGRASSRRAPRALRRHLSYMGAPYILLLTAFYVDNGRSLALWRDLPSIAYWTVPALIGIPLIWCTLSRHPLARA